MTGLGEEIATAAERDNFPVSQVARRHLLQGFLRRWSRSAQAEAFVLRGGLLTQLWAGPHRRATRDVDLVALFPRDMIATQDRLRDILAVPAEDGIVFDLDTLVGQVIWGETNFPGERFVLQTRLLGEASDLQIDVGFGDPIVPPAQRTAYPCLIGPPAPVLAVTPELLTAWKLDGLFDLGIRRWQAKDLHDLYLLTRHCALDPATLAEAIRVAFETHGEPLEEVPEVVYRREWWEKEAARKRWAKFRAASPVPVPESLVEVAADVARALRPALSRLIPLPAEL